MERIRLLCGDELKDKAAGITSACRALFSSRNAGQLARRDWSILDGYADGLAAISEELLDIEMQRNVLVQEDAFTIGVCTGVMFMCEVCEVLDQG